MANTDLATIPA